MSEESMCYVAYCRVCGKARLLAVDVGAADWKDNEDIAQEIARALVDGYIVERVTVTRAKAWPMFCRCGEPGPPTADLFECAGTRGAAGQAATNTRCGERHVRRREAGRAE